MLFLRVSQIWQSQVLLAAELSEVGSIKAFPLPVADEGNALMAQWPEIRRAPLAGVCLDSGATSVAPYVLWLNETWQTTYLLQGVRSSNLRWLIRKKTSVGCLFSVIFALRQVILLRSYIRHTPSDIVLCTVKGKYNITETDRFQYHFCFIKNITPSKMEYH